jgi:hypothetical protein
MNIFVPLSTQSPPSRLAVARSDAASEPVSGSVSPKQPSACPEHSRGSHCCFCSGVPNFSIVLDTSPSDTDTIPRTDESPRASSSSTRQYER